MQFSSSKYTKMRLWELTAAGEGDSLLLLKTPLPFLASSFRPLASKKLCIPAVD